MNLAYKCLGTLSLLFIIIGFLVNYFIPEYEVLSTILISLTPAPIYVMLFLKINRT